MSWDAAFERWKARLHTRKQAYQSVFFTADERVRPFAETVVKDLARYCHAYDTSFRFSKITGQSDAQAIAFAEGQRDVFNRIKALSGMTAEQIERIARTRTDE
jgi:hypothetical protein